MSKENLHPVLAGLAANLYGSLLGAFFLTLAGYTGYVDSINQVIGGTIAIALYGFILALPFIFLYGMPTYAGLKHFGCANYFSAIIFGAIPGIAWISWTHGNWLDPILWNGPLIAFFYTAIRLRESTATASSPLNRTHD